MLLPSFYLAPVSYYALIMHSKDQLVIEQHDSYTKQTYRNRCRILGANGVLNLVIPVVKEHGNKAKMKDIRIDYDTNWQRIHWKSIEAAYKSAPFYEFYIDSFEHFYFKKEKFLIDLNQKILQQSLELLEQSLDISLSTSYKNDPNENEMREAIHPKRDFSHMNYSFTPQEYYQVFIERYGFKKDLSILDLLMNEGPQSSSILRKSIVSKHLLPKT